MIQVTGPEIGKRYKITKPSGDAQAQYWARDMDRFDGHVGRCTGYASSKQPYSYIDGWLVIDDNWHCFNPLWLTEIKEEKMETYRGIVFEIDKLYRMISTGQIVQCRDLSKTENVMTRTKLNQGGAFVDGRVYSDEVEEIPTLRVGKRYKIKQPGFDDASLYSWVSRMDSTRNATVTLTDDMVDRTDSSGGVMSFRYGGYKYSYDWMEEVPAEKAVVKGGNSMVPTQICVGGYYKVMLPGSAHCGKTVKCVEVSEIPGTEPAMVRWADGDLISACYLTRANLEIGYGPTYTKSWTPLIGEYYKVKTAGQYKDQIVKCQSVNLSTGTVTLIETPGGISVPSDLGYYELEHVLPPEKKPMKLQVSKYYRVKNNCPDETAVGKIYQLYDVANGGVTGFAHRFDNLSGQVSTASTANHIFDANNLEAVSDTEGEIAHLKAKVKAYQEQTGAYISAYGSERDRILDLANRLSKYETSKTTLNTILKNRGIPTYASEMTSKLADLDNHITALTSKADTAVAQKVATEAAQVALKAEVSSLKMENIGLKEGQTCTDNMLHQSQSLVVELSGELSAAVDEADTLHFNYGADMDAWEATNIRKAQLISDLCQVKFNQMDKTQAKLEPTPLSEEAQVELAVFRGNHRLKCLALLSILVMMLSTLYNPVMLRQMQDLMLSVPSLF